MARHSAYSAKNIAITIDGLRGEGLWDGDDAVSVEPLTDVGQMLVGADGSSIFSQSANEGATITLRVMHNSNIHRLLHQKWARQKMPGIRTAGFPVNIIEVDSGEGGSTPLAFIQTAPSDTKGTSATVREWVLVTGDWKPEIPRAV